MTSGAPFNHAGFTGNDSTRTERPIVAGAGASKIAFDTNREVVGIGIVASNGCVVSAPVEVRVPTAAPEAEEADNAVVVNVAWRVVIGRSVVVEPVPHAAAEVDRLGGVVGHNESVVKIVIEDFGMCTRPCGGPRRRQLIVALNRVLCVQCDVTAAHVVSEGLLDVSS